MSLSSQPSVRHTPAPIDAPRADLDRPDIGFAQLSDAERHILQSLRSIRFGSIDIVVHDSKIVQIERSEKVRFDVRGKTLTESLS